MVSLSMTQDNHSLQALACPPVLDPQLLSYPHWVGWKYETHNGRPTKVPIDPHTGKRASTTDRTTWAAYDAACAAKDKYKLDGIGFVFSGDNPYCGLDLDAVRNPATGELTPEAQAIVDSLNSYTEVSPSGTGIHVFIEGALPPGGRGWGKGNGMYCDGRFFTVTGQHLADTPTTVEERQEALTALHTQLFPAKPTRIHGGGADADEDEERLADAEVLRLAQEYDKDGRFAKLWAGDWASVRCDKDNGLQQCYPSQSEADLALASILAFYAGPDSAAQVDRLFRQSGLLRDKWEDRDNYREGTLELALDRDDFYQGNRGVPIRIIHNGREWTGAGWVAVEDPAGQPDAATGVLDRTIPDSKFASIEGNQGIKNQETWRGTGFQLTTLADLLNEAPEETAYVVADLLPTGGLSILAAKPKVGKSTLARNLALAVARGEPFLGRDTARGAVVYLALEEKRSEVHKHFASMGAHDEAIIVHVGAAPQEALAALQEAIAEHQPVLVIIEVAPQATVVARWG
jgi:putative DNA primase/helicase